MGESDKDAEHRGDDCVNILSALPKEELVKISWKNSGFSIHEEVRIKDWDREGLERLLGYCSRPALSQKRLVYAEKADTVLYRAEPKAGRSEMLAM